MQTIAMVREADAADERVREAYRDIKDSLRVSMVNFIFQAYGANPKFIDYTWRRLRPSMLAQPFVDQARLVGDVAGRGTEGWPIGDHVTTLHSRNYGNNDLRKLLEIVELFNCVDPKLLIIAHAVRVALMGEPIGGAGVPDLQQHIPREQLVRDFRGVIVALADEKEAPLRVRTIYEEIARMTGVPFVSTDYRAMGSYPDWLEVFWNDCRPLMRDARYQELCERVDRAAQDAARQLPYPLNVSVNAFPDMVDVNDVCCRMLPGLIVNMAIARRGLGPEPQP